MDELRERILASYEEALWAFDEIGASVSDWERPTPCGAWSLLDLSGHLLAIARYWTRLIDAAETGEHVVDLPRGSELAAMNAHDLLALAETETEGSRRMELFVAAATAYLRRLEQAVWEMTLGAWSGLGPLTVGQHSGVAIGEWHVHAWDMARSIGSDHRPSDALVVAQGNRVVREIPAEGDPWLAVLTAYGRDPGWHSPAVRG